MQIFMCLQEFWDGLIIQMTHIGTRPLIHRPMEALCRSLCVRLCYTTFLDIKLYV